jgi:REP element-mobilizing transposase RayT
MALFQQSVIKKHLESFDKNHIEERWQLFRGIFHTAEKQQNIRNSKEEQYQEGFLRDLFVTVLGYTINPEVNFNLLTEQKNVNNSKKADGAVLLDGRAIAVIELKGTETTDLNKIEIQAFGYKNNQPGCNYVITSNFEKLRFYIDNTTQQEEFNLFTLTKPQFELLYACLAWESISKNTPMQILNESVSKENIITKSLYKDYSEFKRALFANLVEMNPQYDKLVLFKKTQKLLDRFLFIFFAEDRLLLPTNLIFRINKEWENIIAQRIQVSLYDRYKMYFNDLNIGAKVTLPAFGKKTGEAITAEFEIFAYNGGLFQPDDLLDNIQIDDTLLHTYTQRMSNCNFESDVDVNILGHIFENSLNEIDEIKSEIEGNVLEKTKTRRKKDGVFYTPKYITKYIVDNTIGKLCTEKKEEIKLLDEDFVSTHSTPSTPSTGSGSLGSLGSVKSGHSKAKKKDLLDKLTDYRNWLLDLTICDPACGSGAFLNQALEFLIAEHRYVDELQAKLLGDSLILSDIENSILERNIYGVDLNDESVEIAKLSLWLRTAQKGRKLNSLNNNIKCGNSLIDDPAVAGDKAFSWEKEFPEVFKEKNKRAYHITTAIHDSRTSQRMIDHNVRERRFHGTRPEADVLPLSIEDELLITQTISDVAIENKLNILAFNICKDHMHILLVCEEQEIPKIVQRIKGRSSRVYNTNKGFQPLDLIVKKEKAAKGINPLVEEKEKTHPLWTQKYGCNTIESDEQLWNTVNYIEKNRVKHNLPKSPKLEKIIFGFVKSYEDAFKAEYKGGFDVVIGNPPYVNFANLSQNERGFFQKTSKVCKNKTDLYAFFIEKSTNILNNNGSFSFIFPHTWVSTTSFLPLREFIYANYKIENLVELDHGVFQDAVVKTVIIVCKKGGVFNGIPIFDDTFRFRVHIPCEIILNDEEKIINLDWNAQKQSVENKIFYKSVRLDSIIRFTRGIKTSDDNRFLHFERKNDEFKKIIRGRNIKAYRIDFAGEYIWYRPDLMKEKVGSLPHTKELFEVPEKLVTQRINSSGQLLVSYDEDMLYFLDTTNVSVINKPLIVDLKYLLVILNSKLINWWFNDKFKMPTISGYELHQIPIKIDKNFEEKIVDFGKIKINQEPQFRDKSNAFIKFLSNSYKLEKLPGKLEKWYELEFVDFIKELNKAIKGVKGTPLTKKDEFEWMDLFEENKKKALELKAEIDRTDKEIDNMVYELYELSEEEIKIVEGE